MKGGFKCGREQGIEEGLRMNFDKGKNLSDVDYKEIIDLLLSKNCELVCYDVYQGGLRLKKAQVQKR